MKKYLIISIIFSFFTINANAYQWKSKIVYNMVNACMKIYHDPQHCGCKADEYQKIMSLKELLEFENKILNHDHEALLKYNQLNDKINTICRNKDLE
jgi:hypothetical protein